MEKEKSVYQCCGEYGLTFGIYLSAGFFSMAYSGESFLLGILAYILILAAPIMLFRYMRKYYNSHPTTSNFSTLWTVGTLTTFCAALISTAVTFAWLEYIEPTFIYDQANAALIVYESVPELKNHEFTKMLRHAIENHDLPTPIKFAVSVNWTIFTVSVILSMILAPLAKLKKPSNKQQ